jgi:simple sugar transport system permease protein
MQAREQPLDDNSPEKGSSFQVRRSSVLRKALLRPELTAVASTVVVFAFFAISGGGNGFLSSTGIRNVLAVSADVGIIAAPMSLLMIAGEFDLSVASMYGIAGIIFAYPVVNLGWPLWAALLLALLASCVVGLINGLLVVITRIPSFLVTLATLFGLQGLSIALAHAFISATSINGMTDVLTRKGDVLLPIFTSNSVGIGTWIPIAAVWWLALSIVGAWILDWTRGGNWIYATGGSLESAMKAGIPVKRVKVLLFMATSCAATLASVLAAMSVNNADINAGTGEEFQTIVAVVIGGTLIWGGYGTVIGSIFGALFFGLVSQGFFFTNIDSSWFQALLGGLLLVAVVVNRYTRTLSMRQRRV